VEKEVENIEIIARTHRLSKSLYERICSEANKTGNAISNEMNSIILDGLRFREARITVHLQDG